MKRSLWLSLAAFVLGAGLLVAAGFAGAATGKVAATKGGTMRMNMSATDVDFTDPSLAYGTISWQIEFATALKLYNYPDKAPPAGGRLQPEGASGFPIVSKNGKVYTIPVKSGYKFSDGSPVTAANYVFAMNRALSPSSSPDISMDARRSGWMPPTMPQVRCGTSQPSSPSFTRSEVKRVPSYACSQKARSAPPFPPP